MKKILLIGFYEPREHIICIKQQFEENNFIVDNYPLFKYIHDTKSKIQNVKDHLNMYIKDTNPDIVLWLFLDVDITIFTHIKQNNPNIYYIMYNSDDPVNFTIDILEKAKIFNIVITPCAEYVTKYKLYSGVETVLHIPAPFDNKYYYPLDTIQQIDSDTHKKYSCDISMFCLNLLENTTRYMNQYINRKSMIDELIKYSTNNNKIFKIYGPQFLKEIYKNNYGGIVNYNEMIYMLNYSKINISTHVDYTKSLCLNEHDSKILGSGGLLLIDPIKDIDKILTNGLNCIIMNKDNYIQQIDNILKNYDVYSQIKKNGYNLSENFKYDHWIRKIIIEIGKHFFSPEFYSELYDLKNMNNDELLNHWITEGIDKKHLCYAFKIPDNFNVEKYIDHSKTQEKDLKKIYLEWMTSGKDNRFIIQKSIYVSNSIPKMTLENSDFEITTEEVFDIMHIFNKISNVYETKQGIEHLKELSIQNPNLKINDLLDTYIRLINK
ncbi:hypothetical protein QKU48_gp1104 [Fadolivirus algeromassiliense]|jgi:hypothetical protein|uniref:Spore protein YkvP/CgeB glycosyl transferase-like domain-containing protein n=1 Tax=Fadolivirus FV1/VV64 TaxID=3070911 RepID=A0A7D3R1J4_9VIRU|nr:hypothetical protein QKU48_gp1104 [Fadolivirus algeromassiliense]QKF94562.1 hypothetical protein Fadolivirus_1_1104 [Fadolivirus FV1/VV64]